MGSLFTFCVRKVFGVLSIFMMKDVAERMIYRRMKPIDVKLSGGKLRIKYISPQLKL